MKKIIISLLFFVSVYSQAQSIQISNSFLSGGFFDFGVLDPFKKCQNTILTMNNLTCQELEGGKKIRISLPTSFTASNSASPVELRLIQDPHPVPGSPLEFSITRNGTPLSQSSVESFFPNVPQTMTFLVDIWLFGPNSTNQQVGEISLELIIP